jgi:hypothetical protein
MVDFRSRMLAFRGAGGEPPLSSFSQPKTFLFKKLFKKQQSFLEKSLNKNEEHRLGPSFLLMSLYFDMRKH